MTIQFLLWWGVAVYSNGLAIFMSWMPCMVGWIVQVYNNSQVMNQMSVFTYIYLRSMFKLISTMGV